MDRAELTSEDVYRYMLHCAEKTNDVELKLFVALVKSGHADFLFLRDDYVRNRWAILYSQFKSALTDYNVSMKQYLLKSSAYEKLTDIERSKLRIRKPRKPIDIWK